MTQSNNNRAGGELILENTSELIQTENQLLAQFKVKCQQEMQV